MSEYEYEDTNSLFTAHNLFGSSEGENDPFECFSKDSLSYLNVKQAILKIFQIQYNTDAINMKVKMKSILINTMMKISFQKSKLRFK